MITLKALAEELQTKKQVVITTHIAPDPDAIGSSSGLALGLAQCGIDSSVYLKDRIPDRLLPLLQGVNVFHEVPKKTFPTLIVVDTAAAKRVGDDYEELFSFAGEIINIDHHISNERFGKICYLDTSAAASAEIVYLLLRELPVKITKQIAELLFAGLSDDTGSFRFSNTSQRAFDCASALLSFGVKPQDLANLLYFSLPRRVLQLRTLALSGIRFLKEGKISLVVVTKAMLVQCGAQAEDTEGIIDEARAIEGTIAAVFIRELDDGWKVSLRSKDDRLDVNKIAALFGGGGHAAASGCKMCGTLLEVESKLLPKIEEALNTMT